MVEMTQHTVRGERQKEDKTVEFKAPVEARNEDEAELLFEAQVDKPSEFDIQSVE